MPLTITKLEADLEAPSLTLKHRNDNSISRLRLRLVRLNIIQEHGRDQLKTQQVVLQSLAHSKTAKKPARSPKPTTTELPIPSLAPASRSSSTKKWSHDLETEVSIPPYG